MSYFLKVLVCKMQKTGQRVRKLMRGNTISEEIYQVNCKFDGELPVEAPAEEPEEMLQKKKLKIKKNNLTYTDFTF